MDTYVIYALIDPCDSLVYYVGMTNNLYRRFREHISCRTKNPEKNTWIAGLKRRHMMPVMKTLETTGVLTQATARETYWISHYQTAGMPLLNHVSQPDDWRTKVGRRMSTEETKQLILSRLRDKAWPGDMSQEMRGYYERNYIYRDGKYHAKVLRWKAESKYKNAS